MSVYFLTLGTSPLLGDDIPLALLDHSVPLMISERVSTIEGKYDLSSCKSCFYDERLTSDKSSLKPIQPILSIDIDGDRYPVFKSRRMGGAPYAIFKLFLEKFSVETVMNMFNLLVGVATLIFMFLSVTLRFSRSVANISVLLAGISPVFVLSYSYYITEQLIALSFWIMFFLIQRDSKVTRALSVIVFIVSIYFKLNFLVALIPLYLLNRGKFHQNYKVCASALLCLIIYVLLIFSMGDSASELISRGGEGYRKPFMHTVLWAQEFIALFSRPSVFLNEQLGILNLKPSYTNDISFLTFHFTGIFSILFFIYCICSIKDRDVRITLVACFLWSLAGFFVGHLDVTYTARFSEVTTLMILIVSLSSLYLYRSKKLIANVALVTILTSQAYFLWNIVSIYQERKVQSGTLSIEFNREISEYLVEHEILNPILTRDESEWGVFELHSKSKITPIYAQNLDETMSLKRIVKSFNSGHVLFPLREKVVLNDSGDNEFLRFSKEDISKALSVEDVKFNFIKEFSMNGQAVYTLFSFERNEKLKALSEKEDQRLLDIKFRKFYR
ncbi:hypothetical protein BIY24_14720 [Halobacteriovorax marinus]|uniref:hypothetical protein n=1 Tax=Halobacteriovorax marinus TaxID=97084 RepID=UPI000BC2D124|nr:hypothetical protein [Halobacteriovorax marinus]ATH09150.1 hypothetical protein BIY24_14720 [Halobacteriovorax marinus]